MSIVTRIKAAIKALHDTVKHINGECTVFEVYLNDIKRYCKKYAYKVNTGTQTISPGGSLTVIDFSGWGALISIFYNLSGVPLNSISVVAEADNITNSGVPPFGWNPNRIHSMGFNAKGIYDFGAYGAVHEEWDTTNNIFKSTLFVKEQTFLDHYKLVINNNHSTDDLTAVSIVFYYKYYASKDLKLLLNNYNENLKQIHERIKKDYKVHNAVYKFEKGKHLLELTVDDNVYDKKKDKLIEVLKREGLEIKDVL